MALPIEVCELVIDHLADHRYPTWRDSGQPQSYLYHCCLVSRSWLPRARHRLYRRPYLYIDRICTFHSSLLLRPDLGAAVEVLVLSSNGSWTHHQLSLLPVVLPRQLPNLQHILFQHIHFRDLHPSFFRHMHQFRGVSHVTCHSVVFATPYLLSHLVTSLPSLQQLDLGTSSLNFSRDVDSLGDNPSFRSIRHKLRIPRVSFSMHSTRTDPDERMGALARFSTLFCPASIVDLLIYFSMPLSSLAFTTNALAVLQLHSVSLRSLTVYAMSLAVDSQAEHDGMLIIYVVSIATLLTFI